MAEGTETDPIVFTSNGAQRKPGDWGGLVILGMRQSINLVELLL